MRNQRKTKQAREKGGKEKNMMILKRQKYYKYKQQNDIIQRRLQEDEDIRNGERDEDGTTNKRDTNKGKMNN